MVDEKRLASLVRHRALPEGGLAAVSVKRHSRWRPARTPDRTHSGHIVEGAKSIMKIAQVAPLAQRLLMSPWRRGCPRCPVLRKLRHDVTKEEPIAPRPDSLICSLLPPAAPASSVVTRAPIHPDRKLQRTCHDRVVGRIGNQLSL